MSFENGEMVTVGSGDMAEKMKGLVGVVIDIMKPSKVNEENSVSSLDERGDITLYRVEFLGGKLAKPQGCPTWWPEEELRLAD